MTVELVPVRVRDCACPNTPHAEEGDLVFLRAKPSLALGMGWQVDMVNSTGPDGNVVVAEVRTRWYDTYVRHGAVSWNLMDENGPVPFSADAILADFELAYPVAEKADELYASVVMRPLLPRPSDTSRNGQTDASTSPRVKSIPKRRASSSPATSAASTQ